MDLGIRGKRALVCAASRGLGKAIAWSLAREGVELFLCARSPGLLQAVAQEIEAVTQTPVQTLSCDLSEMGSRNRLIEAVQHTFPVLDILIHNTGGPKPSAAETTPLADWETGFQQLFMSVAHLNQAFLPQMKAQQWGRVVTVTSSSVIEPIPNLAVSNAMRAAVTAMLKTLASELAPYNVCINCVAPGIIHTDRTEERIQHQINTMGGERDEILAEYAMSIPAGRLGSPQEYGDLVAFLCAEQASYITGVTYSVDGGKRHSTV